ncbi:hypothetical protein P3T23_002764 [Paraburkholderia sp. GAS448]
MRALMQALRQTSQGAAGLTAAGVICWRFPQPGTLRTDP